MAERAEKPLSIAKLTERYIDEQPAVKDCLVRDLVNFSALAREIVTATGLKKKSAFDAVLVAARRYAESARKEEAVLEPGILRVLRKSKVEVKTRVATFVIERGIETSKLLKLAGELLNKGETIHLVWGSRTVTLILQQEFAPMVRELFGGRILEEKTGLVEFLLKSPPEIETTPGVMDYLFSLFGERGINVQQTLSCYTDTVFVMEEKDTARTIALLSFR